MGIERATARAQPAGIVDRGGVGRWAELVGQKTP